jgi:hypothetical protein
MFLLFATVVITLPFRRLLRLYLPALVTKTRNG